MLKYACMLTCVGIRARHTCMHIGVQTSACTQMHTHVHTHSAVKDGGMDSPGSSLCTVSPVFWKLVQERTSHCL